MALRTGGSHISTELCAPAQRTRPSAPGGHKGDGGHRHRSSGGQGHGERWAATATGIFQLSLDTARIWGGIVLGGGSRALQGAEQHPDLRPLRRYLEQHLPLHSRRPNTSPDIVQCLQAAKTASSDPPSRRHRADRGQCFRSTAMWCGHSPVAAAEGAGDPLC